MIVVDQHAVLETITADAASLIERAGRTCYKSEGRIEPGSAARFIKMLRQRGHLSVLEHASATVRFITDRGVTHELVRHRLAAYSQESTRYCNYAREGSEGGGQLQFVRPVHSDGSPFFREGTAEYDCWVDAMNAAELAYVNMIAMRVPPQLARTVLPNSLKTEIVMTANFREWLHVIDLRTGVAAHPQIRHLVGMARRLLAGACPEVFEQDATSDGSASG